MNPENTIFEAKRLIGRNFDDSTVQTDIKGFPYTVINKDGKPYLQAHYQGELKTFSPEDIFHDINQNERDCGKLYRETVTDAVITVPAYFNDSQRQATKDAGHIGIECIAYHQRTHSGSDCLWS